MMDALDRLLDQTGRLAAAARDGADPGMLQELLAERAGAVREAAAGAAPDADRWARLIALEAEAESAMRAQRDAAADALSGLRRARAADARYQESGPAVARYLDREG